MKELTPSSEAYKAQEARHNEARAAAFTVLEKSISKEPKKICRAEIGGVRFIIGLVTEARAKEYAETAKAIGGGVMLPPNDLAKRIGAFDFTSQMSAHHGTGSKFFLAVIPENSVGMVQPVNLTNIQARLMYEMVNVGTRPYDRNLIWGDLVFLTEWMTLIGKCLLCEVE